MQEVIEKPDRQITAGMKHGTYDKLDEDGIAPPGTRVSGGAIVLRATAGAVLSSHACVAQVWGVRWGIESAELEHQRCSECSAAVTWAALRHCSHSCFASVQSCTTHVI